MALYSPATVEQSPIERPHSLANKMQLDVSSEANGSLLKEVLVAAPALAGGPWSSLGRSGGPMGASAPEPGPERRAARGDRVTVHYRGRIRGDNDDEPPPQVPEPGAAAAAPCDDGGRAAAGVAYFDDSWARGKPLTFTLGFDPGSGVVMVNACESVYAIRCSRHFFHVTNPLPLPRLPLATSLRFLSSCAHPQSSRGG